MENKLAIRYKTVGLTGLEKVIETFGDADFVKMLQRNPAIYNLEIYKLTKIMFIES